MQVDFVDFTGDCYGEAWPGGPWLTSASPGLAGILHMRVAADGRAVGQAQGSGHGMYIVPGLPPIDLGTSAGINVAAFHPSNGEVYLSTFDGVRIFTRAGEFRELRAGYIGSQGIRNIRANGSIITGDETAAVHLGLNEYTDVGDGCLVGQGNGGGLRCWINGSLREIISGAAFFVRVNRVLDNLAIAFAAGHRNFRVLTTMGELGKLPDVNQPAQPVQPATPPPPPPTPIEVIPLSIPNQFSTVEAIRAHYPTPLGARHPDFLVEVAQATNGKLLRKDSGTHVTLASGDNVSQDIVVYGSTGVDILSDGEGAAVATWQVKDETFDDSRLVSVGGLPTTVPAPIPNPSPKPVDGITREIVDQAIQAALGPLEGRIEALEPLSDAVANLTNLIKQVTAPKEVATQTGRSFGHSHSVKIVV